MRYRLNPLPHALVLAAALLCAGCWPLTDDESANGRAGESPGEAVEVTFWHGMPGTLKEPLEHLVDRFNSTCKDGHVVLSYQGDYGTLRQKTYMALQAGNPPDLAQMFEAWTTTYNSDPTHPALLALDDLVREDNVDMSDFYPSLVADNTFDGHLLSFPFNKSFPVIFYNRALFKRAGLDPDRPPATWDQMAEYGRKLTSLGHADRRQDCYGWAFPVDPWVMLCQVLQDGGELARGDRDIQRIDVPAVRQAMQYLADAVLGDHPWAVRRPGRESQNDFIAQRCAMIVGTSVSRTFMLDQIQFPLGVAPIPMGQKTVSIMSGTNVGIFASASPRRRRVAWDFIKFFTLPENTAYWAIQTGYVPVRRSAVASREFQDYLRKDPTPMAAIGQLDSGAFEPRVQDWFEIRDKLGKAIETMLLGQMTVDQSLQWAQQQVEAALQNRKGKS